MIYFDHASTSYPKPNEVVNEISCYLNEIGVNPGRGSYTIQKHANDYIDNVRAELASLFHIANPSHIAFSYNATHSINTILKGYLKKNSHVIVCSFSHNAVMRPLELLRHTQKIEYDILPIQHDGRIDLDLLKALIRPTTSLVIFNHASNVIGVRTHFEKALPLLSEKKIPILLDITQTAGLVPLNIEDLGIDFLVGTGHKTLQGPPGIGFLYIKNPEQVNTLMEGGSSGNSSSLKHPEVMPDKFEAGTINYVGIAGLKGALESTKSMGFKEIMNQSMQVTTYAWNMLSKFYRIQCYGSSNMEVKIPVISFTIQGLQPNVLAQLLSSAGSIATRPGLHCAPVCHRNIGTYPSGTLRLSFGHKNTTNEIDFLEATLKHILKEE